METKIEQIEQGSDITIQGVVPIEGEILNLEYGGEKIPIVAPTNMMIFKIILKIVKENEMPKNGST